MSNREVDQLAKDLIYTVLPEIYKRHPKMTDECREAVERQIARVEKFLGFGGNE